MAAIQRRQNGREKSVIDVYDVAPQRGQRRAHEAIYRLMIQGTSSAILLFDRDGALVFINEAGARTMGRSAEALVGLCLPELFPDRYADYSERHRKVIDEGMTVEAEDLVKTPTGAFWCKSIVGPARDALKEICGVQVLWHDVSRRRHGDLDLRSGVESEKRLSLIFDNVSDCIFLVEVTEENEYRFVSMNDAFAKCTGLERAKVIGRKVDEWLPAGSVPQLMAKMRVAVTTRRKVEWTQSIQYPRGTHVAEFAITPILDESGKCAQLICCAHDVTEIRRLTAAALRAAEEEQQRIGRDLHDGLGQEMTGIALYCGLLEDELKAKKLPEAASATHLSELINGVVVQVGHISRGLQPVPDTPDGLRTGLRRLAAQVSALRGKTGVLRSRKNIQIHDSRVAVHLYRIAQEAVQNALRHGRAKTVSIRLGSRVGRLHLEVEDDGKGIAPNWESTAGIGFQTMKFRAESLGGTISVTPSPTGGTLVRCVVPDPSTDFSKSNAAPDGSRTHH
jgi:PAS domain S-box-containing protein